MPISARFAYAGGNLGINLVLGLVSTLLLYFYTDIVRVSAGTVAVLFVVARGLDGLFDPFMGILIDRTNSRIGKHRPYLFALAAPFGICSILVFVAPELTGTAKIVYIYVTYTLLGILYSATSLPLNSMLPTLTKNPKERNSINALREFFGTGSFVSVGYLALPAIGWLGRGDKEQGYLALSTVFAAISVIGLILAAIFTREVVRPRAEDAKIGIREGFAAARGNMLWIATIIVNLSFWTGFICHIQSTIYFAKYCLHQSTASGTLMATMAVMPVGTVASGWIANRIGKGNAGLIGAGIATLSTLAISSADAAATVVVLNGISFVGLGLTSGLLFSFMADAVDFGEIKSGFRAQGFLFSASSLGVKIGMSVGGAAGAWLLVYGGYSPNSPGTRALAASVMASYVWLPVVCYVVMGVGVLLFKWHLGAGTSSGQLSAPVSPLSQRNIGPPAPR